MKNHIVSYLIFYLEKVKVETKIEHGDPRDVICQMTEKLGADVLVMGSHGYGLIKRWVLKNKIKKKKTKKEGNYRHNNVIIVNFFLIHDK